MLPRMRHLLAMFLLACVLAPAHGADVATITLTSKTWHAGQPIPMTSAYSGFGVHGGNISPDLTWSGAPLETKSFALTMYDPDAPTGVGFVHWVIYNIPAEQSGLPSGAGTPDSTAVWQTGLSDMGTPGYVGPAPPPGDQPHHYIITVYALDQAKLDLPTTTTYALLKFSIRDHVLATGQLTGTFKR
jgi:Raf kinase inhibitor-like YbhB/YbcL family protein